MRGGGRCAALLPLLARVATRATTLLPATMLLVFLLPAVAAAATTTPPPDPNACSLLEMMRRPVPGNWPITGDRVADYALLSLGFALAIPLARKALCRAVYEPLGRRMIGSAMLASRQKREQRRENGDKANGGTAADAASTATPRRTTRRSAAAAAADASAPAKPPQPPQPSSSSYPSVPRDKMLKWTESAWKLTAFTTLTCVALYVVVPEPWILRPDTMFLGSTRLPLNILVKPSLMFSYALQTGFYLQSIPFLLMVETRRKDFAESMAHHLITVCLLVVSWAANFTRAGVIFTLIHDASDIFLESAKLMRYCRRESAATGAFVMFALSWIALRVFYYPKIVLKDILLGPLLTVALPNNIDPQPWWSLFATLFTVLWGLHLYWTYLIVMVIVRKFTKGAMDDVREEGSDDGDDDDSDDD
jgi:hypothetical protein